MTRRERGLDVDLLERSVATPEWRPFTETENR